ncbi:hypothetical protein J7J08_13070 [Stenotrophomonas sp. ISL-67]|uniref:hypothetical protein n=1 Tax=Stenotrophomonas sp. ISL-67 TaxID=2819171 RepID=UPI001BEAE77E|nr:hypothetical protein [Stenotrophomonas sp. ISL-67]MBT2768570.1 hypothetical protein [Stenotrophomonas sp. ISL-67]
MHASRYDIRLAPTRPMAALMVGLVLSAGAWAGDSWILGNVADSEALEYPTVAAFVEQLPKRRDVEVLRGLPLEPGMLAYQSTKAAVAEDPAYSARTWLIFTAPHPMAPSVARLRTYVPEHELHRRLQAWATLCESTAEGCARMDAYLKRVVGSPAR